MDNKKTEWIFLYWDELIDTPKEVKEQDNKKDNEDDIH